MTTLLHPLAGPGAAPMLRNVTGADTEVAVAFDPRSAYDFLISLDDEAATTDEVPAADRRWRETARASLPEALRDRPACAGVVHVVALLAGHPEVTDAAATVELVRGTAPAEIARMILADQARERGRSALIDRALAGDEAAIGELVASQAESKRGLIEALVREPATARDDIAALLEAWLPHFREIEGRVAAIVARDVERRRRDAANRTPVELIEDATGGIRWLSEPGVHRVILAPSYFGRPYNFVFAAADWRLFAYPVADAALDAVDPLAPPAPVIRLHRALGDDTRLRILRLLRDRDWYLTEIAERLELSKPTIKHHLALLRAAGLVTLIEEGGLSYYSLRRERLDDAATDLKHFLLS